MKKIWLSGRLTGVAIPFLVLASSLVWGCGDSQAPSANSAASGTAVTSPERQEVDLIMDWVPWVLDIPVDVAQAKGFYEREGLKVRQTLPAEATDVAKFVATGRSEFGLYYSPDLLMALGEGAPLVSIGAIMSHAPVGLAFRPGLTPDSPTALEHRAVSIPLIPSTRASFASMLTVAGVDPQSVEVIDPGFELVAPLLSGTVDAAAFTEFGELVEAETQGQNLAFMDFRDWGTPDYAFLDLITNADFAGSNPNTIKAFLRAFYKGLTYAAIHPQEAVSLYVKAHPELDSGLLLAQWEAAIPFLALASQGRAAGWQDMRSWEALNDWMKDAGVTKKRLDLSSAVTNDYLGSAE